MKIYFAITIDTECDKGEKWKVKQPLSFKNTREGIVKNLQPIFDKYKVKATYLLSPEVMYDDISVEVFKEFANRSELGTHLHAEFIEPESNFKSDNTDHYQSDFSFEVEKQKLYNLTQLFIEKFGYQPTSFRAGRFGISKKTLSFLEELGYKVDSSATPDIYWKNENSNHINFFGTPYQPYFPSTNDARRNGNLSVLEVPVSTINKKIKSWPLSLKRKLSFGKSFQHILFNYATNFSKPEWIRPTISSAEKMAELTKIYAAKFHNQDLFLCMMFHSNEFDLETSPYSMNQASLEKIINRLDDYLAWLSSNYDVEFVGLSDFVEKIKK